MKANYTALHELTWKSKGFAVDEIPVYTATPKDIDQEKFQDFFKEHRASFKSGKIDEHLLLRNFERIKSTSRQTASRKLSKLVKEGKLTQVGKGPAARYKKIPKRL